MKAIPQHGRGEIAREKEYLHGPTLERGLNKVGRWTLGVGDANLAIMQRYLDHIAPKDLVEAIRQREWII